MKKRPTLRIGGVPEHFNLPWRLALESGALADAGLDASWQDFPGGTGSMVEALNAGTVDIAVLLTEGAVKAREQGADFEILCFYTQTPLIWGVHVPGKSNLKALSDLERADFAISRFGSGSHLMAYLLAAQQNWNTTQLSFELIGNLDGARALFQQQGQHAFLWEKFMTQPLVDKGEFRRIAELPTPWPCFVVCVRKPLLTKQTDRAGIEQLIELVLATAQELKSSPVAAKLIAARYGLKIPAVAQWLSVTQWSKEINLDACVIEQVKAALANLELI